MTNLKIERLGRALMDDLIMRFLSAANPAPVTTAHDAQGDLYLTVTDGVGSTAIVKFEPEAAQASGQYDSLGLAQAVYTPHITKLGFDAGSSGVKASDVVTLTGVVATNTILINGVTFTCTAGAPAADGFQVGADDAHTAANLAAAVVASANAGISGIVTASNVAGQATVTITAVVAGVFGNNIPVADGGSLHFSPATATLAGGTNPTPAGTSDNLRNILIAECAPTGTALLVYEKAGIAESDLKTVALLVTTVRNIPFGQLAQM